MRKTIFVFLLLALLGGALSISAAGVVGTGTPASCTEAALDAALVGGGVITFNCGASPHTIALTGSKTIRDATNIDGGGRITLDGGGYTLLFYVQSGASLELRNLTLQNARAIDGGAIKNDGATLRLVSVTIRRSESVSPAPGSMSGSGGAIYNAGGTVEIFGSRFLSNFAARWGGAIFTTGGTLTIRDSVFLGNRVQTGGDDGGAIAGGSGSLGTLPGSMITILNSRFGLNTAPLSGGAIFSSNGGAVSITGTNFVWNLANVGGAIRVIAPNDSAPTTEGLTIYQSQFLTNVARYYGGAVDSGVPTTINEAVFKTNSALGGGAIQIFGRSGATITHTNFERNRATTINGGAVLNYSGSLRLLDSLFNGNFARGRGGAIFTEQRYNTGFNLLVANSTITRNRALRAGGGIYVANTTLNAWVRFATIAYNQSPEGANIWAAGASSLRLNTSIVTYPIESLNCSTAIADISWLVQFPDSSCGGGTVSDPLLAALADNGGLTWTHALRAGSPAIDSAMCATLAEGLDEDQRDYPRPADGNEDGRAECDNGAYEFRAQEIGSAPFPLTAQTATPAPTLPLVPTFAPTQVVVNCQPFRLTSPRDGLPNGGVIVYWDGAPGATGYSVIVLNENGAAVASQDASANSSSLNIDVSQGAIGGGFTFTIEAQALLNGQTVCRDSATMLRSSPNVPTSVPQCGNGIQEPGENPNNCPNGY